MTRRTERTRRRAGRIPHAGRRRAAALGGAAALLLAAFPAAPAPAQAQDDDADAPAGPAPYRVAADAEPVEGSAATADAPRLDAGGVYADVLEPGAEVYYRVVLDDVSDYYLAAVAAPTPGARVAYGDGIRLRLQTTGGDGCGSAEERTFRNRTARPIAIAGLRTVAPDGDCQAAGTYLLKVARNSDPTSDPEPWPLELRVLREPPVRGGEVAAPPPARWVDAESLPAPPAGEPRPVRGGTGFDDARPVGEGVWRDSIAPGATLFYRVPVDWHQQLAASVELSNAAVPEPGTVFDAFMVEAYTPYRTPAHRPESTGYSGEPTKHQVVTAPVAHDHRAGADDRYVERMRVAGWHYLAVHLNAEVAELVEDEEVALTLRVSLLGEASPGPEYDGDLAAAGLGVTEEAREQAREGKDDETLAEERARRDTKQLLGYAGIGTGTALLLVLAVWRLAARRRGRAGPA